MQIIDFHTHIYPQKIAEKATKSTCDFYGLHTGLIGTADVLLESGKKAGISGYLLLPVATRPDQTRHINQFTVGEVKAHSEFYGFGTLHAAMSDIAGEVEYIESVGLKGIKLHPDIQQFAIDDERMFPVYGMLEGRLPLLIHCGDLRYDFSHPRRLLRILERFPRLEVIAAHLGGWSVFGDAFDLLKDTDCYVDISSCMSFMPEEQLLKYINGYGADRVLFGSDFPLWNPSDEAERFLRLPLRDADREKIAFRNARRILGLDA